MDARLDHNLAGLYGHGSGSFRKNRPTTGRQQRLGSASGLLGDLDDAADDHAGGRSDGVGLPARIERRRGQRVEIGLRPVLQGEADTAELVGSRIQTGAEDGADLVQIQHAHGHRVCGLVTGDRRWRIRIVARGSGKHGSEVDTR